MVLQANFNNGETVNYNGKTATVCSAPLAGSTITIEVDGEMIRVDKNDLFGMNTDISQGVIDRQIAECDEQIARNKSIIKHSNIMWDNAKEQIKAIRNQMQGLLTAFGVSTVTQLADIEKAKYLALRDDKTSQRLLQIRASSNIMSAAINTSSVCSHKQDLLHTSALLA